MSIPPVTLSVVVVLDATGPNKILEEGKNGAKNGAVGECCRGGGDIFDKRDGFTIENDETWTIRVHAKANNTAMLGYVGEDIFGFLFVVSME